MLTHKGPTNPVGAENSARLVHEVEEAGSWSRASHSK